MTKALSKEVQAARQQVERLKSGISWVHGHVPSTSEVKTTILTSLHDDLRRASARLDEIDPEMSVDAMASRLASQSAVLAALAAL